MTPGLSEDLQGISDARKTAVISSELLRLQINDNGQRLLEFCSYNSLCVTNSFFQTKPQHRVSWCHPRSKHWHQLDLILIRRSNIKLVQITRTYHSADCDTDHSLVCCKIRLQPKKLHKSKQKGKPRMNIMGMHLPEKVEEFAKSLQKALSVEHQHCSAAEKWDHLRDTNQKTALATFGKKTSKNNDWFDAKFSEMSPVIDAKRAALAEYKRSPNEKTLQALRAVRSKVQQTARRCANEYWQQLSDSIQENTVAPSALDAIEPLAIMEELDAEPTIAELYKAIDSLASGKAPGNDGIPPDLIKCCKNTLLQPLHDVLCQCWKEGAVPQDMRDAKIVTLYKNKGERSDWCPMAHAVIMTNSDCGTMRSHHLIRIAIVEPTMVSARLILQHLIEYQVAMRAPRHDILCAVALCPWTGLLPDHLVVEGRVVCITICLAEKKGVGMKENRDTTDYILICVLYPLLGIYK
ncbi:uncharacterized protein LOC143020479 [Oratosquilla oratoria]|uniref:uncharacterized protein LOC143020479 n=1 Tax=Oratosquilla oratoria TaxID=337810 RepID=UPI003F771F3D